jgi:hypothetical protein
MLFPFDVPQALSQENSIAGLRKLRAVIDNVSALGKAYRGASMLQALVAIGGEADLPTRGPKA